MSKKFETKDSGKRKKFDSGMKRDTQEGKPRFDLLIPLSQKYEETLIYRWASLMGRGAEKYGKPIYKSLNIYQLIQHITEEIKWGIVYDTKIDLYMQKDIVEVAMKKDSEKIIQNLLKDNVKIEKIGVEGIKKKLKNLEEKEEKILKKEKEIKEQNCSEILGKEDSRKKVINYYWNGKKINAQFVERFYKNVQNILIMTTEQDSQEVIYVMAAIEVWECLETLLKVLSEQFNILKGHQLKSLSTDNYQLIIPNERNWEKANSIEELKRAKASCFRHFIQAMSGELDEDHFSAIAFNLNMVVYLMDKLGVDINGTKA